MAIQNIPQQLIRIEEDPIGLNEACGYFYRDADFNVFQDDTGKRPVECDECKYQMKMDSEGYFYCPQVALHEDDD